MFGRAFEAHIGRLDVGVESAAEGDVVGHAPQERHVDERIQTDSCPSTDLLAAARAIVADPEGKGSFANPPSPPKFFPFVPLSEVAIACRSTEDIALD